MNEICIPIDDTVPLQISIVGTQRLHKHDEYRIRVQRGDNPEQSWIVMHRYSDFALLYTLLRSRCPSIELPLPPKRILNTNARVINDRRDALEHFLNVILKHPMLTVQLEVMIFLDPNNYSLDMLRYALRDISMLVRSELNWTVLNPLPDIGWRLRKYTFLLESERKKSCIGTLVGVGCDAPIKAPGYTLIDVMAAIKEIYTRIKHPYIAPVEFVSVTPDNTQVLIVRELYATLKDLLHQIRNPTERYILKYQAKCSALNDDGIRRCGREILESLSFLYSHGLFYGNLHSGNVLIIDNRCCLSDLENVILGQPSKYKRFMLSLPQIVSLKCEDVYSFGHVLFEMATGRSCSTATIDKAPDSCSPMLASVLESILSPRPNTALPSIDELLLLPYFQEAISTREGSAVLGLGDKMDSKTDANIGKEIIKGCEVNIRRRALGLINDICDEHTSIMDRASRNYRAYERLTSEEKQRAHQINVVHHKNVKDSTSKERTNSRGNSRCSVDGELNDLDGPVQLKVRRHTKQQNGKGRSSSNNKTLGATGTSSPPPNNNNSASKLEVLQEQRGIICGYLKQAKLEGKDDDVESLRINLNELMEEIEALVE